MLSSALRDRTRFYPAQETANVCVIPNKGQGLEEEKKTEKTYNTSGDRTCICTMEPQTLALLSARDPSRFYQLPFPAST